MELYYFSAFAKKGQPGPAVGEVSTLISAPRHKITPFYLKCLDPGSGRKIPAIWHDAGANLGVYPRNLVLKMANFVLKRG